MSGVLGPTLGTPLPSWLERTTCPTLRPPHSTTWGGLEERKDPSLPKALEGVAGWRMPTVHSMGHWCEMERRALSMGRGASSAPSKRIGPMISPGCDFGDLRHAVAGSSRVLRAELPLLLPSSEGCCSVRATRGPRDSLASDLPHKCAGRPPPVCTVAVMQTPPCWCFWKATEMKRLREGAQDHPGGKGHLPTCGCFF